MAIRNLTNDFDERYLVWLCGLVVNNEYQERLHASRRMIDGLFEEPFFDFVPNDDNRAAEGRGLRDRYQNETAQQINRRLYMSQCTLLEMLVGLAHRYAWEIVGLDETVEENIPSCFWTMIDNLELNPTHKNLGRLSVFNKREYKADGSGGLFPLANPKEDQREVELWFQMMAYIMENED